MQATKLHITALLTIFILIGFQGNGQSSKTAPNSNIIRIKPFIKTGNIESQFNFMMKYSNNYQSYEVVPKKWILQLKSNIQDSITQLQNHITQLNTQLEKSQKKLKSESATLHEAQTLLLQEKNNKKQKENLKIAKTYISWGLVILFAYLTALFFYKFRKNTNDAYKAKDEMTLIKKAFQIHKKNAIEKRQKLMRKLQDELNKKWNLQRTGEERTTT